MWWVCIKSTVKIYYCISFFTFSWQLSLSDKKCDFENQTTLILKYFNMVNDCYFIMNVVLFFFVNFFSFFVDRKKWYVIKNSHTQSWIIGVRTLIMMSDCNNFNISTSWARIYELFLLLTMSRDSYHTNLVVLANMVIYFLKKLRNSKFKPHHTLSSHFTVNKHENNSTKA
jgi:hypothetical protein